MSWKGRVAFAAAEVAAAAYGTAARRLARLAARRIETPARLHLGSGNVYLDGWVNVDWAPTGYCLLTRSRRPDLCADLAKGLPFPERSATHVYSNNFLEHLERESAERCLAETARVLLPGGRVRIVVPDAEAYVRAYAAGDEAFFAAVAGDSDYWPANVVTAMESLVTIVHGSEQLGWRHLWAYDFETLALYLGRAGLVNVRRFAGNESNDPVLAGLDGQALALLAAEATAPA